jgi:hypothetical protein
MASAACSVAAVPGGQRRSDGTFSLEEPDCPCLSVGWFTLSLINAGLAQSKIHTLGCFSLDQLLPREPGGMKDHLDLFRLAKVAWGLALILQTNTVT